MNKRQKRHERFKHLRLQLNPTTRQHLTACPVCDGNNGALAIGNIICKGCREGDYLIWCNENNVPKEYR